MKNNSKIEDADVKIHANIRGRGASEHLYKGKEDHCIQMQILEHNSQIISYCI